MQFYKKITKAIQANHCSLIKMIINKKEVISFHSKIMMIKLMCNNYQKDTIKNPKINKILKISFKVFFKIIILIHQI